MKKLKIDIYSDIHIDSWVRNFSSEVKFKPTKGTNLCVFAGDAGNGVKWYADVVQRLKEKYQRVVTLPGNHDWYGNYNYNGMFDLFEHDPSMQVYDIDGFTVVTSTLWTNFRHSVHYRDIAEEYITDFRAIRGMTGAKMAKLCNESFDWLSQFAGMENLVVATHFAPLKASEHPAYAGSSQLNPYFINDEPEFVEKMGAKLWIHGHTHKKFDYTFKGTRVVANPIGYCMEEQQLPVFLPKHVELEADET